MSETEVTKSDAASDTLARRKIRAAAAAKGYEIEDMYFEPIGAMIEKSGREGGWTIFLKDGEHVLGYSWRDVVDFIERHIQPKEVAHG